MTTADMEIKVLLIEDDIQYSDLLATRLSKGSGQKFILTRVERFEQAHEKLSRESYDVILLDIQLPDTQGGDTLNKIQHFARSIPVVVLTGNDQLAMQAINAGVQDYLVKGQADVRFISRILRYAIERKRNEERLRARTAELEQLNSLMAGRERKLIELKTKINLLKEQIEKSTDLDNPEKEN
ncbi:MAG: response regulator [Candidatus Omnitrophica bacterium]|nr:response regulator [Candidatus Omnitrophota bacterium]